MRKRLNKKIRKKHTGFADLGHYDWETEKKKTKKQIKNSGWE